MRYLKTTRSVLRCRNVLWGRWRVSGLQNTCSCSLQTFLPARDAVHSAVFAVVRCLFVRHTPVLCPNG